MVACGGGDEAGDRASTRSPAPSSVTPSPSASAPSNADVGTTVPPPAPTGVPGGEALPAQPRGTPARIVISSIEVDAPVVDLARNADASLAVPDWEKTGWWERGPEPGQRGPAVVVGHVDSTNGPAVFSRLDELRPGAVIEVALDGGGAVRYGVLRTERFAKDAFPSLAVYGLTPGPELRLITCDGEFDTATGHYVDNLVVFATALP
ncbi:MAG TPA: class F sortase [Acidimicrobiales bacterium]|nr:class F sortase [Acidimicrobiales bacterium]